KRRAAYVQEINSGRQFCCGQQADYTRTLDAPIATLDGKKKALFFGFFARLVLPSRVFFARLRISTAPTQNRASPRAAPISFRRTNLAFPETSSRTALEIHFAY